jgi:hypothetical protein
MHEQWRPVVGYESVYEVSSHGRVRSFDRTYGNGIVRPGRMLVTPIDKAGAGYRFVNLCKNGIAKKANVHVLVLEAFVGPRPSSGHQACHEDGDRTNAALYNLRWDTVKGNCADMWAHGTMQAGSKNRKAILSEEIVCWIRESRQSSLALAPLLGVSSSAIRAVRIGQTWGHLQ